MSTNIPHRYRVKEITHTGIRYGTTARFSFEVDARTFCESCRYLGWLELYHGKKLLRVYGNYALVRLNPQPSR